MFLYFKSRVTSLSLCDVCVCFKEYFLFAATAQKQMEWLEAIEVMQNSVQTNAGCPQTATIDRKARHCAHKHVL